MMLRVLTRRQFYRGSVASGLALSCIFAVGCQGDADTNRVQGYVEGEYVYVASPLAGELESRKVDRGDQVARGDLLFQLDDTPELAARNEAKSQLAEAHAKLADAKKGKRPTEIESLAAELGEARAGLKLAEQEFVRRKRLLRANATAEEDVERARAQRDQASERVAKLEADLATARLGSRSDEIDAAAARVESAKAVLAKAEWGLAEKQQSAAQAGEVIDTLFREGEWVAAGAPVVVVLPPANVKVRAFVPEKRIAEIQVGEQLPVVVDGLPEPLSGRVRFISPKAEFTPPVIYSRETRSKLVFMIELSFDDKTAARLHPGQPVDVELKAGND